jgi:type IV pilus assembly protein PilW
MDPTGWWYSLFIGLNNPMKKSTVRISPQKGFSLIELLVSIAIGVVILAAIGVVYLNGANINRQKEDLSDVNEPAKMINNLLKYNVSLAGYIDPFDASTGGDMQGTKLFTPGDANLQNLYARSTTATISTPLQQFFSGLSPVFGCDGDMTSTPNAIATATPPVTLACSSTTSSTQNSVQFAFQIAPLGGSAISSLPNATATASTGEGNDCLQQALPTTTAASAAIVVNRFYIQANPVDSVNELYCAGSGNTVAKSIARGVEEFVVRYQMAPASTTIGAASGGTKAQFLTATQVAASTPKWAGVTAVEICMVTATVQSRGAAAVGTAKLQPDRQTCERETSSDAFKVNIGRGGGDTRLWKRSTFTYSVRNAIFAPV